MATVKKGILSKSPEWWKHLRPYNKRKFWGKERKASQRATSNEAFSGCGCIFCDIDFKPDADGNHHLIGGGVTMCTRRK